MTIVPKDTLYTRFFVGNTSVVPRMFYSIEAEIAPPEIRNPAKAIMLMGGLF